MNFKKKLENALLKAGLSEDLAEIINITSEDQIEGAISKLKPTQSSEDELDFKKVLSSKEFTAFVATNGVGEVLKASTILNREYDKKVSAGIKTFKQKFVKDDFGEDEDDEGQEGKQESEILKSIRELKDEIKSIKDDKTKTSKLSKAESLFSKSEVLSSLPEKLKGRYLKNIDIESETSIEDQIKDFESEASELKFSTTKNQGLPMGGQSSKEASEKEIEEIFG